MGFVAIDLGASGTRYVPHTGKIGVLPNNMVFLSEDTRVDFEPYTQDIEDALDVTIKADKESEYFPVRVLVGPLATRYSATNQRPSGLSNKHMQKINYVSAVLAMAVCKYKHNLEDDLPMYMALPPIEVRTAKDTVKEKLQGTFTVTFNKTGITMTINVTDVSCYEESFMALLAYFFEMNGKLKPTAQKYSYGNVLSLDIGASTTDLAVVSNLQYQEKSGQTYKTGGNIAREFLTDDIRGMYGYDVPHEIGDLAMAEGRLQTGNSYVDISKLVQRAKERFAEQVVEQITDYFRKINIPIQSIRAIIVSGGGSMKSEYVDADGAPVVTSEPMSYYITKELNKFCPGVEVEPFSDNPRLANITGLFIRASIDMAKKQHAMQAR